MKQKSFKILLFLLAASLFGAVLSVVLSLSTDIGFTSGLFVCFTALSVVFLQILLSVYAKTALVKGTLFIISAVTASVSVVILMNTTGFDSLWWYVVLLFSALVGVASISTAVIIWLYNKMKQNSGKGYRNK